MNDLALILAIALSGGREAIKDISFSIDQTDGCLYVDYPVETHTDENSEEQNNDEEQE